MTLRFGIDTGGTFTDVIAYDVAEGEIRITKTPSTPPDFDTGVLTGIERELDGVDPSSVSYINHGTTVGTNAVIEEELPDLGLITNEGLRDVLEIGDQRRPAPYDFQCDKPPTLIPRRHRTEVEGRLNYRGEEITPLDKSSVRDAVRELDQAGVSSIVVSTLFSYLNDAHERGIGEVIESIAPGIDYTLSSAVHPEMREYERTVTTVLNEAIKIVIHAYLERLDAGLSDLGVEVPLNVMHSGGGVFSAEQAIQNAVRTLYSGPAGGAVAVKNVSEQEGLSRAIGIDMGGTSADVSIVRDGDIVRAKSARVNDLPIQIPIIDIQTVGAGGGSIAWIDAGGALRVGPQSSSANPGPICYGKGGQEPTVTDANLLLGRLNPDYFLGGEMDLAVEETRRRFEEVIADPLGQSVDAAALSVLNVANASLAREIRRVTVECGHDPREFTLVAFGGAGPLQATPVATELGMDAVLVPQNPGVFSARGLLIADVQMDEVHAYRGEKLDEGLLTEQFNELESRLLDRFVAQGHDGEDVQFTRAIDTRYRDQAYELTIPANESDAAVSAETIETVKARFHEEHARRYGHARKNQPVEFVTLRVTGRVPTPDVGDQTATADGSALKGNREVYFGDSGFVSTDVFDRTALDPGETITGPAILEEPDATTLVPPGTTAETTDRGNIRISISE